MTSIKILIMRWNSVIPRQVIHLHRCLKTVMDLGQILGGLDILRLVIFSARDLWTLYSDVISSYHPNIYLLFAFLTK